jgi:hypothetical protein
MNIVIKWFVSKKEDSNSVKIWRFSTDSFNHETPKVGDYLSLDLPISKVYHLGSKMDCCSNYWLFKIIRREWTPLPYSNQPVVLEVEIEDIQKFLDLSKPLREGLKNFINEEEERWSQEDF